MVDQFDKYATDAEKRLRALELLTGLTPNDIARMRTRHISESGEIPQAISLPCDAEIFGMKISIQSGPSASTFSGSKHIVHLIPRK